MKRAAPRGQQAWDSSCDGQEDTTARAENTYEGSHGTSNGSDSRSKGYSADKIREMAIQTAQTQARSQSQSQTSQSRGSQSLPPSHNTGPRSNTQSSVPPPAPPTGSDPKILAAEIASLEQEMENCSNAVRRLQIRKSIATKRAIMLGPM